MNNDIFSSILGQPQVRDFLRSSLESRHFSQSYLFLGPSGSNKTQAAHALAFAFLYSDIAKSSTMAEIAKMQTWKKTKDHTLADIHYFEPEGQNGYLVTQMRDIIHDEGLSPINGNRKVYIIDRVDLLGVASANAFLKTLEEPNDGVMFILLGRTHETVLPTIESRCVVVPFRHIPPSEAIGIIVQNTGVDEGEAKAALGATGGSISASIEFLRDRKMVGIYDTIAKTILASESATDWQIVKSAKEILEILREPTDELRRKNEQKVADEDEFLSSAAKKSIEASEKRAQRRKEKQNTMLVPNIATSLLHDVFSILNGREDKISNPVFVSQLEALAKKTTSEKLVEAIDATNKLTSVMAYNVSLESCIDLILLEFKGAFSD